MGSVPAVSQGIGLRDGQLQLRMVGRSAPLADDLVVGRSGSAAPARSGPAIPFVVDGQG